MAEDTVGRCPNCGGLVEPKRKWHKYCSDTCRHAVWERDHPRQKIGVKTTIVIGDSLYRLTFIKKVRIVEE